MSMRKVAQGKSKNRLSYTAEINFNGLLKLISVCFIFFISFNVSAEESNLRTLTSFERLYITDRPTPPDDVKEGWVAVELKELWPPKVRKKNLEAWYRTEFELDQVPEIPWGIYIARISSTASIWLNDVEIGNTDIYGPEPNAWNHPQLFELPKEFLKVGKNSLHIRLKVIETEMGMLYEPVIGSYSELKKIHDKVVFFKITASKILSIVMTICVAIMLVFYFYMRLPSSYLWFIAGSTLWVIYSLELFVINVPLPNALWDWLAGFSIYAAVACYFAAVVRMLGLKRKKVEIFLWALAVLHPLGKLFLSSIEFSTLSFVYLVVAAFFTIYISVMLCYRGWQRRKSDGVWMLTAGSVIIVMVFYDAVMFAFQITSLFAKFPYIPLVSTVLGAGIFFARLITTYKENENYKLSAQSVDTAINSERERLLREIHDGVGGQLVSTLAILAKGDFKNQDIMDSVKTSLDDLRLIISSLEPASHQGDVLGILATVRERLEHRLLQAGIKLHWAVKDIPTVERFNSEQALHLMRILQEAITNVVKHADATEIILSCDLLDLDNVPGINIKVADNGIGVGSNLSSTLEFANKKSTSGYGIKNMRKRMEFLHGTLVFEQSESGSLISLWFPVKQQAV